MKSKSEPTAGRSGTKGAGKGKVKVGKLQLNKETVRDLSPGKEHIDAVRGGAPGNRCSGRESGCN